MGLSLGSKDKRAKRPAKAPKKTTSGKSKVKSVKVHEVPVEEDDEIITASNPEPIEEAVTKAPKLLGPFEGGLVNPALRGAVNTYWKRSPESDLFLSVLTMVMMYEGTFFGSIYVKTSFLRKTGGSAIL